MAPSRIDREQAARRDALPALASIGARSSKKGSTLATKATTNTPGSSAPGAALLDAFEAVVSGAEQVKASTEVTTEIKAARQARSLLSVLLSADEGSILADNPVNLENALTEWLQAVPAEVSVDRTEGNALASKVTSLMGAAEYAPLGFDLERADALVSRWKSVSGRAPRGEGKSDPAQRVGFPISLAFTYPEGAPDTMPSASIQHDSTWSSVSAEISKRACMLDGIGRGEGYTRPAPARDAWRAARKAIKAGEPGPFTVEVPTKVGAMLVQVTPVR